MSSTRVYLLLIIGILSIPFNGETWSFISPNDKIELINLMETDVNIAIGQGRTDRNYANSYGWWLLPPREAGAESNNTSSVELELAEDLSCVDNGLPPKSDSFIYGEQFVDGVLVRIWKPQKEIGHACIPTNDEILSDYFYSHSTISERFPRESFCNGNNDFSQYFSGIALEDFAYTEEKSSACRPVFPPTNSDCIEICVRKYRYVFRNNEDSMETLAFENDDQLSSGGEEIKITYYIKEFGDKENKNAAPKNIWNSYVMKIAPGENKRPVNYGQEGRFWSRSTPVTDEIYISARSENYRYGDQIYCISSDRTKIRKPTDHCYESETPIRAFKKKLLRGKQSNTFVFSHQTNSRTTNEKEDNDDALMQERTLSPEKRVILNFTNNTGEEINVFYFIQPREYDFKGKTLAKGWFTVGTESASRKEVSVFDKLSAYYGDIYIYARGKTMRWGSDYNSIFHCAPVNSPFVGYENDIFNPSCPNYNMEISSEMMPVSTFVIKNAKPAYTGDGSQMKALQDRKYSVTFKKDYAEVADSETKQIPTLYDTRVELCNQTREPLISSILFPEKDHSWTSVKMHLPAAAGEREQCVLYEEPLLSLPDDPYTGYIAVYAKGTQSGRTWSGKSPDYCMSTTHLGEVADAPTAFDCADQTKGRGRLRWVNNEQENGIQRIVFGYGDVGQEKPDGTVLEVCNTSTDTLEYAFGFETEVDKEIFVKGWVEIDGGSCIHVEVPIDGEDYTGEVLVYAKDEKENEFNRTEKAA